MKNNMSAIENWDRKDMSKFAYEIADAMMEAREQ